MTCVYKEYEVRINMVKLKMKYSLGYNMKLVIQLTGDNTDQNGGWYPILGALFGLKPKI